MFDAATADYPNIDAKIRFSLTQTSACQLENTRPKSATAAERQLVSVCVCCLVYFPVRDINQAPG